MQFQQSQTVRSTAAAVAVRRRYWLALLIMVGLLPFVVFGARSAIDGMRITPEKWVSKSHPERRTFETFRRQFEGNDVVLISWDGCTADDPRLARLEQAILAPADEELAAVHRRDYDRVVTGASVMDRLTRAPLNLSEALARERLQGTLIGPDGQTTCALVVLTYAGNERRGESIRHLKELALESTGLDSEQLRVAGPPHDGVAIDRQSLLGVNLFSTLCTLLATVVCGLALRSWRMTGVIIGVACFGQGLCLAMVYYLGLTLDAILIVMPALVFVLTVSAGVHLANYYAEAAESASGAAAVVQMLATGWKPCVLAATTTAVGLGSLVISGVTPVLVFGVLSAASLLATTGFLLLILPGELLLRPVRPSMRAVQPTAAWASRYLAAMTGRPMRIVVPCMAVMILSAVGLRRVSTSVDALALFSPQSRIARDYHWFESKIGAVVPVEVVIDFAEDNALGFRHRVEAVKRVHQAIASVDGISGVVSPLTFSPELPDSDAAGAFWRTAAIYKKMDASREDYIAEHYLYEAGEQQSWRLTGHVSAVAGTDYTAIRERLSAAVTPVVESLEGNGSIRVRYTGMMPLIQSVQTSILNDLVRSFLMAFLLIAVAIGIVLRSLRLTLLAMLPNLFPTAVIFGSMGWLDIPVDIGTMMTASVALGIAVDDTIHFLASYRRSLRGGIGNTLAVRDALGQCSRAMLQTTLICASGMLVFCFSSFVPTFRFGLVMALSLTAALVGDLVFLPALLVSPIGGWVTGLRMRRTEAMDVSVPASRSPAPRSPAPRSPALHEH